MQESIIARTTRRGLFAALVAAALVPTMEQASGGGGRYCLTASGNKNYQKR